MTKKLGTDKDIEKRARQLRKKGWRVELTKGNHLCVIPPGEEKSVLTGSQSGSSNSVRNFLRDLNKVEREWEMRHPDTGKIGLPYDEARP